MKKKKKKAKAIILLVTRNHMKITEYLFLEATTHRDTVQTMYEKAKTMTDTTFIYLQAMAMAKPGRKLYNWLVVRACHRVVKIFNTFHHVSTKC